MQAFVLVVGRHWLGHCVPLWWKTVWETPLFITDTDLVPYHPGQPCLEQLANITHKPVVLSPHTLSYKFPGTYVSAFFTHTFLELKIAVFSPPTLNPWLGKEHSTYHCDGERPCTVRVVNADTRAVLLYWVCRPKWCTLTVCVHNGCCH